MTSLLPTRRALRAVASPPRAPRRTRERLAAAAVIIAFALVTTPALAPPAPATSADRLTAYINSHAQGLTVPEATTAVITRDSFAASSGIESLAASGTNYDWAKLVLLSAGFPQSEGNVTVFTRWMRQENGADDWWNRNNPLNNGWGSGGGGGTGSYDNLVYAAQMAAEALHSNPGYGGIVAGFAASAPTAEIESAIWASPWASGHYANGGHWSYVPVTVVKSPDGTW